MINNKKIKYQFFYLILFFCVPVTALCSEDPEKSLNRKAIVAINKNVIKVESEVSNLKHNFQELSSELKIIQAKVEIISELERQNEELRDNILSLQETLTPSGSIKMQAQEVYKQLSKPDPEKLKKIKKDKEYNQWWAD
jgi:hypothetical protein